MKSIKSLRVDFFARKTNLTTYNFHLMQFVKKMHSHCDRSDHIPFTISALSLSRSLQPKNLIETNFQYWQIDMIESSAVSSLRASMKSER